MGWTWKDRSTCWSLLVAVLLFGTAYNLSAQQLSVAYLDGRAEVQAGKSWETLSIGDQVAADGKLKLEKGAYVELRIADSSISLSQSGTYSVETLVAATKKPKTGKANSAIIGAFQNLIASHAANQSTVMGARGANESAQEQQDWVSSTSQVYVDAGKEFIKSGEYPKAIERFRAALSDASTDEVPEIKQYLAYAYSLNGNTRDSFKEILEVQPAQGEEWAPDYVLLRAKLLVDTNAYNQAIELLAAQGEALQQDERRAPMYFLLLALV